MIIVKKNTDDFDKLNWAFTPSIDNQSPYGKNLNVCK